jgi:hydroxyacylglutathione hydrolase
VSYLSRSALPVRRAPDLTPAGAADQLSRLRIIDLRGPHEFSGELGHIHGSELVPLVLLESECWRWDKRQPLLLVCSSGRRSSQAADLLAKLGFESGHHLDGGLRAWRAMGLPVCSQRHAVNNVSAQCRAIDERKAS